MSNLRYGFKTTLEGISYHSAVERVTDEHKKEGFGILTETDVKATLKTKLDVDFRRHVILGACNLDLAHRALGAESHIGLRVPCNIVVQETPDGGAIVSIADPRAMIALVDNADVTPVAEEAETRRRRVIDAITSEEKR